MISKKILIGAIGLFISINAHATHSVDTLGYEKAAVNIMTVALNTNSKLKDSKLLLNGTEDVLGYCSLISDLTNFNDAARIIMDSIYEKATLAEQENYLVLAKSHLANMVLSSFANYKNNSDLKVHLESARNSYIVKNDNNIYPYGLQATGIPYGIVKVSSEVADIDIRVVL